MTESQIISKRTEVIELLTDVFTHAMKTTEYVEKQRVTDEVLRVLEFHGITAMRYTWHAIDAVFANLAEASTLETSNAFGYKA